MMGYDPPGQLEESEFYTPAYIHIICYDVIRLTVHTPWTVFLFKAIGVDDSIVHTTLSMRVSRAKEPQRQSVVGLR